MVRDEWYHKGSMRKDEGLNMRNEGLEMRNKGLEPPTLGNR